MNGRAARPRGRRNCGGLLAGLLGALLGGCAGAASPDPEPERYDFYRGCMTQQVGCGAAGCLAGCGVTFARRASPWDEGVAPRALLPSPALLAREVRVRGFLLRRAGLGVESVDALGARVDLLSTRSPLEYGGGNAVWVRAQGYAAAIVQPDGTFLRGPSWEPVSFRGWELVGAEGESGTAYRFRVEGGEVVLDFADPAAPIVVSCGEAVVDPSWGLAAERVQLLGETADTRVLAAHQAGAVEAWVFAAADPPGTPPAQVLSFPSPTAPVLAGDRLLALAGAGRLESYRLAAGVATLEGSRAWQPGVHGEIYELTAGSGGFVWVSGVAGPTFQVHYGVDVEQPALPVYWIDPLVADRQCFAPATPVDPRDPSWAVSQWLADGARVPSGAADETRCGLTPTPLDPAPVGPDGVREPGGGARLVVNGIWGAVLVDPSVPSTRALGAFRAAVWVAGGIVGWPFVCIDDGLETYEMGIRVLPADALDGAPQVHLAGTLVHQVVATSSDLWAFGFLDGDGEWWSWPSPPEPPVLWRLDPADPLGEATSIPLGGWEVGYIAAAPDRLYLIDRSFGVRVIDREGVVLAEAPVEDLPYADLPPPQCPPQYEGESIDQVTRWAVVASDLGLFYRSSAGVLAWLPRDGDRVIFETGCTNLHPLAADGTHLWLMGAQPPDWNVGVRRAVPSAIDGVLRLEIDARMAVGGNVVPRDMGQVLLGDPPLLLGDPVVALDPPP